jgi:hypothetical protein
LPDATEQVGLPCEARADSECIAGRRRVGREGLRCR